MTHIKIRPVHVIALH